MKIAINGFGRIGRMTLKALQNHPEVEIVAINDLTDVKTLAHLLKYDTAHGLFPSQISTDDNSIFINGKKIIITNEKNPIDLPWKELGIDVVVESTGRFTNKKMAHSHIEAGAKKFL